MLQRVFRWAANDPIHAALTVGFATAFAAFSLDLAQRALADSAPTYALIAIGMLGLVTVMLSSRCASLLVWLSTNQFDERR